MDYSLEYFASRGTQIVVETNFLNDFLNSLDKFTTPMFARCIRFADTMRDVFVDCSFLKISILSPTFSRIFRVSVLKIPRNRYTIKHYSNFTIRVGTLRTLMITVVWWSRHSKSRVAVIVVALRNLIVRLELQCPLFWLSTFGHFQRSNPTETRRPCTCSFVSDTERNVKFNYIDGITTTIVKRLRFNYRWYVQTGCTRMKVIHVKGVLFTLRKMKKWKVNGTNVKITK